MHEIAPQVCEGISLAQGTNRRTPSGLANYDSTTCQPKGNNVTEKFSAGRCEECGSSVGFEDGQRQNLCLCDPWCECCGRQFIAPSGESGDLICGKCIEEEIARMLSEEFLNSLSRRQLQLLVRDISKKWGKPNEIHGKG
jgi:hypothetical protein